MTATDFERRHQTLLHLLVVGLAFLTYLFEPDDIVWAIIKHHTVYRSMLERIVFGVGTLLIFGSAIFQTVADTYSSLGYPDTSLLAEGDDPRKRVQSRPYFGRILFALGLGLLAPIWGTVVLLIGEAVLIVRLYGWGSPQSVPQPSPPLYENVPRSSARTAWLNAFRKEAAKWGLAVTMIVFTVTLRDRIAEVLAGASLILWMALNAPDLVVFMRGKRHA